VKKKMSGRDDVCFFHKPNLDALVPFARALPFLPPPATDFAVNDGASAGGAATVGGRDGAASAK